MRQPKSLTLLCGRWFCAIDTNDFLGTRIFELRWRTRGGELGVRAKRAVSDEELHYANFNLQEVIWDELERQILNSMEEDWT